jgi:serine/threonine protein phosphatase PrpC
MLSHTGKNKDKNEIENNDFYNVNYLLNNLPSSNKIAKIIKVLMINFPEFSKQYFIDYLMKPKINRYSSISSDHDLDLIKQKMNEVNSLLITDNKNNLKKWSMQANSREVITKMFVNGYKKIQQQMKKDQNFDLSGSCAISALLIDKVCYVINLGDSRAVIGGKLIDNIFAIQMSIDHKPSLPEEMERIKKSGGEVKANDSGGPMRVYKLNDTNPGLAVARSLGDCYGHECGVGDEPQVSYRILEETDEFIVMGSDGIWDVMNSVEIVGYVFERINDRNNKVERERIAEEIVEECRKRWIIINKFKDTQVVERIKNDPNLDSNAKTSCIQQFVEQIEKQCSVDPNYQEEQNMNQPNAFQIINPEEKFTGKHNIDDISCVICFFH